jgi:preprotein translocase subunit SecD
VRAGPPCAAFTRENIGRPFAIVVDGRVISAPFIQEPILGGSGQISDANFTRAHVESLAARMRSQSSQLAK